MPWRTALDAEVVFTLTRANYDRSRKKLYAVTGLPRNDVALPKLVPPGAVLVQSENLNPIDDIAADPNAWMEAPELPIPEVMQAVVTFSRSNAGPRRLAYRIALQAARAKHPDIADLRPDFRPPYSEPMIRLATEIARILELVAMPWDGTALFPEYSWAETDGAGRIKDPVATERAAYDAFRAALSGRAPVTVQTGVAGARAAGATAVPPPVAGRSWSSRRVANPFGPRNVTGPTGRLLVPRDPASLVLFDDWWYDTPWGQERVQWIPPLGRNVYAWDLPAAYALPADSLVLVRYPHPYLLGMPAPETMVRFTTAPGGEGSFGLYRSRVMLMAIAPGNEPWLFTLDNGEQAWAGYYAEAPDTDFMDDVVAWVSRTAAVQMLLVGVAAVLTGGAAGVAIQGAFTAAGAAAGSAQAALAGAVISAAAPDQVNAALVAVAEQAPYADLIPYVGELVGLTFQELTVRAHAVRQEQDRLRLELARARQEIVSQQWFGIAKQAIKAVAQAILTIMAPELAPLEQALKALTEVAISAATMAVKLRQAKALAAAAAREVEARGAAGVAALTEEQAALLAEAEELAREIEALEREIAEASGTGTGGAGSGAGSPPAGGTPGAGGASPAPAAGGGIAAWLYGVVGALSTGQKIAGGLALAAGAALALTPKKKARGQG